MGRKRTGSVIERGPTRFEAWVAKEYLGTYDSRELARAVVDEWLAGEGGEPSDTFNKFGEKWLDEREMQRRVRGIRQERSAWNAHIAKAHWYGWPIRRITPNVLQQWVGNLLRTHIMQATRTRDGIKYRETDECLSRKSVANIVGLVSRCFDYALVAGKVRMNPARVLILPPEPTQEEDDDESSQLITHCTAEEIEALFKLKLPPMQRAVFAVAIYIGLSKAEVWGLRWQDLKLDGADPYARIRKGYDTSLKSKRRRRDVPLLQPVRDALSAWKAKQSPTPIAGLVFPADDGGCHHESYTAGWRDQRMTVDDEVVTRPGWRSRAGIRADVTFHALRHTCGSHLLQGTWAPRYLPRPLTMQEVSKWLGHSSVTVTERHYADFTDKNLRNVVRMPGSDAESEAE